LNLYVKTVKEAQEIYDQLDGKEYNNHKFTIKCNKVKQHSNPTGHSSKSNKPSKESSNIGWD